MTHAAARTLVRRLCGDAMLAFPLLFALVFVMHFHHLADFTHFKLTYIQAPGDRYVPRLIELGARRMWMHDPHVLGYLSMPWMLAAMVGLGWLVWRRAPGTAILGLLIGLPGCLYLASLFAVWTSLFAIGKTPPQYTEAAVAVWNALTAPEGVFALTTALSRLPLIGLVVLGWGLWTSRAVPRWAAAGVMLGAVLVVVFADLDNWMLLGMVAMCAGMVPARRALLREAASA